MQTIKSVVAKLLREAAHKIDAGTCEITEDEAIAIINNMTHIALSKEQACNHLNISRSKFDELVRKGVIPKGRKRVGFKELIFYKDEIDKIKK